MGWTCTVYRDPLKQWFRKTHNDHAQSRSYLEGVDKEKAKKAKCLYECFDKFYQDPVLYSFSIKMGLDSGCRDEAVHVLREILNKQVGTETNGEEKVLTFLKILGSYTKSLLQRSMHWSSRTPKSIIATCKNACLILNQIGSTKMSILGTFGTITYLQLTLKGTHTWPIHWGDCSSLLLNAIKLRQKSSFGRTTVTLEMLERPTWGNEDVSLNRTMIKHV